MTTTTIIVNQTSLFCALLEPQKTRIASVSRPRSMIRLTALVIACCQRRRNMKVDTGKESEYLRRTLERNQNFQG